MIVWFAAGLNAQTNITFEIGVDAIHGDDNQATTRNPLASGVVALPLFPHPANDPQIQGVLKKAPYTFRTVTAAVRYLYVNFLGSTSGAPVPLPSGYFWRLVTPQLTVQIDCVVIQCQPGLYGPKSPLAPPTDDEFDPRSGQPWNGEIFPIDLPERVSIQGTSALDTIFDARGYEPWGSGKTQNVFRFGPAIGPSGGSIFSFIDSITIRGCRFVNGQNNGAGILVDATGAAAGPRITNCFIVGNDVGIAILNPVGLSTPRHAPWIVGNTLAWNQIGIFSGEQNPTTVQTGLAHPIVFNNLIDALRSNDPTLPPYLLGVGAGTPQPPSCYEGLASEDVTATTVGFCTLTRNWNGYQRSLCNLGSFWPLGVTSSRTSTSLTPPVQDLEAWLGTWAGTNTVRGDLYVRDVLRRQGMYCAPHDFRLAPMVRSASGTHFQNPLVNQGVAVTPGLVSTIVFSNTGSPNPVNITRPPGIYPDGDARYDAWDWDCEGVGNPRNVKKLYRFATGTPGGWQYFFPNECGDQIDLGADEMGEVIKTGFLDSTRIFSKSHASIAAQTANLVDCSQFFFLNVYTTINGLPAQFPAPQFNLRFDVFNLPSGVPHANPPNHVPGVIGHEWFAQLGPFHNAYLVLNPWGGTGTTTDPPPPFAFTSGQHYVPSGSTYQNTTRFMSVRSPAPGVTPYKTFMRSRVADIGAHALDDIDVNTMPGLRWVDWAEYDFKYPNGGGSWMVFNRDIFQTNPWYDMADWGALPRSDDNLFFYVDGVQKKVREGTLNPPLTVFKDPWLGATNPKSYLFYDNIKHMLFYWGAPTYAYSVGPNGLSLSQPLSWFTGHAWFGYRMNFELFDPDNDDWGLFEFPINNLQTCLVVLGEDAGDSLALPENDRTRSERLAARRRLPEVLRETGREGRVGR